MTQKEKLFKRIKKTGKLSNADARYIETHHWEFENIPVFKKRTEDKCAKCMFVRKKR